MTRSPGTVESTISSDWRMAATPLARVSFPRALTVQPVRSASRSGWPQASAVCSGIGADESVERVRDAVPHGSGRRAVGEPGKVAADYRPAVHADQPRVPRLHRERGRTRFDGRADIGAAG